MVYLLQRALFRLITRFRTFRETQAFITEIQFSVDVFSAHTKTRLYSRALNLVQRGWVLFKNLLRRVVYSSYGNNAEHALTINHNQYGQFLISKRAVVITRLHYT